MLGGGLPSASTCGLAGHQAVGKTQIGFDLLLYNMNVLGRHSLFIETELKTFSTRRLRQIAIARGWEYDGSKITLVPATRIRDVGTQYYQMQRARDSINREGLDCGIIIVDSLTALFKRKFSGRDLLPNRSAELGRHLSLIEDMAKEWNALAVCTCQVIQTPVSPGETGFTSADAYAQFGANYIVWGGNVLRHTLGTWIMLTKKKKDVWEAILFDSSELESGKVQFRITEAGITDVESQELV